MIDRIYDNTGAPDSDATGGSTTRALMALMLLETFGGLRIIVSDDIPTTGSGSSTEYSTFFFTQGAVVTGEQAPIRTQTDRDILALEEAMAVDLHYIYHPVGLKYAVSTVNPSRTVLETVGSWSKVYETKNIGIVRATNVSNQD